MPRIVIDPVTRVGGHLRVEAEIEGTTVTDAWVSGTSYRGLERILEGRDARDAWLLAERACGTCGWAHGLASVRAIEAALGVTPPANARLVRNLLTGVQLVVDEVSSFYLRQAWDWIDIRSALTADPDATSVLARSVSPWPTSGTQYFAAIQQRLAGVLSSSQPGPFAPWADDRSHPGYRLAPETNLMVAAHYFDALDWRRKALQVETILGGKGPHTQTYLVGGMAITPDWGGPARPVPGEHVWDVVRTSVSPLGSGGLALVGTALDAVKAFVEQVFVPDVLTTMKGYRDWGPAGRGLGHFLAFGDFPGSAADVSSLLMPRGRVMDRDLTRLIDVADSGVTEATAHSWYAGDGGPQHPGDARTDPRYDGPALPYTSLASSDRYSWLKAPRYESDPMEVGPLARILVATASGVRAAGDAVANATTSVGVGSDAMFGTLGRILARAIEAQLVAGRLGGWLSDFKDALATGDLAMADLTAWDPATWPTDVSGFALGESSRGALGHWVRIHDGRIARYQIVDGSTWNASPRDDQGRRGALEAALVGQSVADPGRPLELLRTIHAFDPCSSCGVH